MTYTSCAIVLCNQVVYVHTMLTIASLSHVGANATSLPYRLASGTFKVLIVIAWKGQLSFILAVLNVFFLYVSKGWFIYDVSP